MTITNTSSGNKYKAAAMRRPAPVANSNIAQMFNSQQTSRPKPAAPVTTPAAPSRIPAPQRPTSKLASICSTSDSSFAAPLERKPSVPSPSNFFANKQFLKDYGFEDLCADDFLDDPLDDLSSTNPIPQKLEPKPSQAISTITQVKQSVPAKSNIGNVEDMIMRNVSSKQIPKIKKDEPGNHLDGFSTTGGGGDNQDNSGSELVDSGKAFAPVFLSPEQKSVLDMVVKGGKSVFFTGPAGTGKSVLMRSIIKELHKKWSREPEKLAVTASTGLAACNIGGVTLHSFSGIGLGKDDADALVKKVRRNPKAKSRWIKTKCLVIDEISMVDGDLFDKLDRVARKIRNVNKPWGGIQLVLTGDFFQLPPVPDAQNRMAKFAFEASTWSTSIDHTIGLTQVFRQKDPQFANMLNEMRLGRISDQTVQAFRALSRELKFSEGPETTDLYPTRQEVDNANLTRLRKLSGEIKRFEALDTGEPSLREKLLANMMCPKYLELKIGAQVMLIKNKDDSGLFNGLIGKVVSFMTPMEYKAVECQGKFENADDMVSLREIQSFLKNAQRLDDSVQYPVVEFPIMSTGQIMHIHVIPEEWKVEQPNGEVLATRSQLPLILAWALSIHKAQGQTLERVRVDLRRIFEKGQAYVALSRATSQAGLQVLGFEKHKVMAHPKVTGFYNQLYSVDQVAKKGHQTSITDAFKTTGSP
ncbi:hypothetical protein TD95_002384 [Thielaviopsis punctulata]|uniref:ATP-dependent DNA helicase PIF1 n=1 Tax=Thielaviopsis punctulata TaxID=72032 RepID=A0A0F4ZHF8_9PEZI|nr:hypothetical protein TD95_002384 [Thielaviopsis punctulata]